MSKEIVIARRFRGPPQSGNGGYVAGMLAQSLGGPATVRPKAPPPLETRLRIEISPRLRIASRYSPCRGCCGGFFRAGAPGSASFAASPFACRVLPGIACLTLEGMSCKLV
jgi:hypothetical protein